MRTDSKNVSPATNHYNVVLAALAANCTCQPVTAPEARCDACHATDRLVSLWEIASKAEQLERSLSEADGELVEARRMLHEAQEYALHAQTHTLIAQRRARDQAAYAEPFVEIAKALREQHLRPWRQGAGNNLGCDMCGCTWDTPKDERHSTVCLVGMATAALAQNPSTTPRPDPQSGEVTRTDSGSPSEGTPVTTPEGRAPSTSVSMDSGHRINRVVCSRCERDYVPDAPGAARWTHPFSESGCPMACASVTVIHSQPPSQELDQWGHLYYYDSHLGGYVVRTEGGSYNGSEPIATQPLYTRKSEHPLFPPKSKSAIRDVR